LKKYVEVRVTSGMDSEELLAMIEDADLLGAWENDGAVHLYWPEECWHPQNLERLRRALSARSGEGPRQRISMRVLPEEDWNSAWKRSIEPIRIGRRVLIRQSWNGVVSFPEMIELIIDPMRAFGTGYHATTQLAIEWLEDRIRGGERVLDCGTGSGILAMVALRLGAESALGIDNDPLAIECAEQYAAANGFGQELTFRVAGIEELGAEKFDLVLANLDRNTLLRHPRALAEPARPGGALFVTGICPEDYDDVAESFSASGCGVCGARERDGWLALEIRSL